MDGLTEENRAARMALALPALQTAVRDWQERSGVSAAATALIGLAQGAEMVLELSKLQPMLASRVVAMGGRFTTLPEAPTAVTTTHFLHGKLDLQTHYRYSVEAAHHLRDMGCDITAEVVPFVGHALHPDLIELTITKLSTHIAQHLWTAAQEAAPASSTH
jgi:phospholipase/carboxylesterase